MNGEVQNLQAEVALCNGRSKGWRRSRKQEWMCALILQWCQRADMMDNLPVTLFEDRA